MTFVHDALFYSTVDEFLDGTLAFIRDARRAEEPILVGVAQPRLNLLREHCSALALGHVDFVDMADGGRNPNRILPWVLRAYLEQHPGRRVNVIGEPIYTSRRPEELGPCVQHEALINVAFAGQDVSILCPYDIASLRHIRPYAERTHPMLVHGPNRYPSRNYTEPYAVVALLNQPLTEPGRVDDTMDFDVSGLSSVRRLVGLHAERGGLDEERTGDLQLAVTEIATNAVTHPKAATATLRLWGQSDRFVCEIRSAGQIDDIMAGRIVPAADSPRGRGLLVANRLCDLVQTHTAPTGTVTRLVMWLSAN